MRGSGSSWDWSIFKDLRKCDVSSAWMKFDKCDFLENWQLGEVLLFCLKPRRCVWSCLVSTIHKTKIYFQLVSHLRRTAKVEAHYEFIVLSLPKRA